MRFTCLIGIVSCILLAGCDEAALVKRFAPPEDESFASNSVDLLRQGKFDQLKGDLDPSIANSDARDQLLKMSALLNAETPESVKLVGAQMSNGQGYATTALTFEYQFPSGWLLVDVETRKHGNVRTITGMHLSELSDSLENRNKFGLFGKGIAQYTTLVVAFGIVALSLYAAIVCIRAKDLKKKWLWIPFILAGVGRLSINWTTGAPTSWPVYFQIPCVMAARTPYGPWTLTVSFPVVALLFLIWHQSKVVAAESRPPSRGKPEKRSTPQNRDYRKLTHYGFLLDIDIAFW